MENLIKMIDHAASHIITVLVFSTFGMAIYMLFQDGELKARLKGAFLGFFVSLAFAYPTWLAVGTQAWWALAAISSILTIAGQFLPEIIRDVFKKYVRKVAKEKLGVDQNDS